MTSGNKRRQHGTQAMNGNQERSGKDAGRKGRAKEEEKGTRGHTEKTITHSANKPGKKTTQTGNRKEGRTIGILTKNNMFPEI